MLKTGDKALVVREVGLNGRVLRRVLVDVVFANEDSCLVLVQFANGQVLDVVRECLAVCVEEVSPLDAAQARALRDCADAAAEEAVNEARWAEEEAQDLDAARTDAQAVLVNGGRLLGEVS